MTVISTKYSPAAIAEAALPGEELLMRTKLQLQRGWLVLSPRAEQVVTRVPPWSMRIPNW